MLGADLMWQEMLKVRAETREEGCSGCEDTGGLKLKTEL